MTKSNYVPTESDDIVESQPSFENAGPTSEQHGDLEIAVAKLSSIKPLVDDAFKTAELWLKAHNRSPDDLSGVIARHAERTRVHSAAMAQRIHELAQPLLRFAPEAHEIGNPPKADSIVETDDAYDRKKLDTLNFRNVRDAIEFDTDLKATFGLAWIDEELRNPLLGALQKAADLQDDGSATVLGTVAHALKVMLKGHPRAFGRYYTGKDPWPRPSAVVQAEIHHRMPDALWWLRHELDEALGEEATAANTADLPSDRSIDDIPEAQREQESSPKAGDDPVASAQPGAAADDEAE